MSIESGYMPETPESGPNNPTFGHAEAPNNKTYYYRIEAGPDEDNNPDTFIEFPDLPGCMTQIAPDQDPHQAALEILGLWIETEVEQGHDIPEPNFNPAKSE